MEKEVGMNLKQRCKDCKYFISRGQYDGRMIGYCDKMDFVIPDFGPAKNCAEFKLKIPEYIRKWKKRLV